MIPDDVCLSSSFVEFFFGVILLFDILFGETIHIDVYKLLIIDL